MPLNKRARVALLALSSRLVVLAATALADAAFSDLDSSARLQRAPCDRDQACAAGSTGPCPPPWTAPLPSAATLLEGLTVWDTTYFARIAKCGYESDKLHAFFPLLPALMRTGASAADAVGLGRLLPPEALYEAAGLGPSLAAFVGAAVALHALSLRVLGDARLADLSTLLFCCNPASVFYSAAYTEALFAAATFGGLALLEAAAPWAGAAALAAAGALRSNGLLGAWFVAHVYLAAATARRSALLPAAAARAACACLLIAAPYLAMQVFGYRSYCSSSSSSSSRQGAGERPGWCDGALPSLYGHVQREYWDVGLLRFYRDPARLPMVLSSLPVALLSLCGCWAYFSADWQRALTLGLLPRGARLPPLLAPLAAWLARLRAKRRRGRRQRAAAAGASAGRGGGEGGGKGGDAFLRSPAAAPYVFHWALMTAVALLAMHVNVATRFLSTSPALYWYAATRLQGAAAPWLWCWCLGYAALGCLLFPNFYPWT